MCGFKIVVGLILVSVIESLLCALTVYMDWTFIPSSEEEEDFMLSRAPMSSRSSCCNDLKVEKRTLRLRNLSLSKEEFVMLALEKDIQQRVRVAIDKDARLSNCSPETLDMKCAMSKYHWRLMVSTLVRHQWQKARVQARVSACMSACWCVLGQRVLRRQVEKTFFDHEQSLVEQCLHRNSRNKSLDWSFSRVRQACLLCTRTVKHRFFYQPGVPSCWFSLQTHIENFHSDLGKRRRCVCCGRICSSEWACIKHQLVRHIIPSMAKQTILTTIESQASTLLRCWKESERWGVAKTCSRSSCFSHMTVAEVNVIMEDEFRRCSHFLI